MEEESVTDGRTVNTTNYAHFKHDQKHTVTPNSQPDNNHKNSELHIKVICKSITSHNFATLFWSNLIEKATFSKNLGRIRPKYVGLNI